MKKIFPGIVPIFFCCIGLNAQTSPTDVSVNDLFIPNAPGFVLSDKAPAVVDKPVTPRAFGVSLLNLWQGGAVDVTPYWLKNRPSFTFDHWIDKRFTAAETFNLSAATFKTDSNSVLSAGFRTQVFRMYTGVQKNEIQKLKQRIVQLLAPDFDENGNLLPLADSSALAIKELAHEMEMAKTKGMFAVELAGAILGASENNSFKHLASTRSGLWLNFRWSPAKSDFDVTGLLRYSWANNVTAKSGTDSSFLDVGAALNYQKEKFNFSFEIVNRNDLSVKENYTRLALITNYVLNENIIVVASLGKNFTKTDNIIAAFGLKFGMSRAKLSIATR